MEYIICISAGHGPSTAGKRSPDGTLREFQFNHPTAQKLSTILKRYEGVTVEFVYDAHTDTPLSTRISRAKQLAARHKGKKAVYVSIHANAHGSGSWTSAKGIETFAHENKPKEATELAGDIQRYLIAATGRENRGVKFADFYELRETPMPAVLVECGFMTNKEEAGLLKSAAYQQACAEGISRGLIAMYGLKPIAAATTPPAKPEAPTQAAEIPKEDKPVSQTPSASHADAVKWAMENGISDGSNPQEPLTREQGMHMFKNFYDAFINPPRDRQASPRFTQAVEWVQQEGISDGMGPTQLPDRQQIFQMLMNMDNREKE